MRNRFDQQLEKLNVELVTMGALCEDALTYAIKALFDRESDMAERAEEAEKQIDQMERDIESICMRLLLQQQPVARDLRTITAAMKMVTDMERIGDHAADISEMTISMGKSVYEANLSHINKMASETVLMLNWSIEAYVSKDKQKAKEVIDHDDIVDRLFDETKKDIINLILQNPKDGEEATDLLMVAKYFERIGDHATNIAEWVIYSLRTSADEN